MVRTKKIRNVLYPPKTIYFSPHGVPVKDLTDVIVTVDEYEAIRLADHKKLKQEEAAKKMNISRPTFTRVIESARKKVAEALVNGKAVKVEGGSFNYLKKKIRCINCSNIWGIQRTLKINLPCPNCGSTNLEDIGNQFYGRCPGRRRGNR